MRKKITNFEIIDHGVDHSQYFQGCGHTFTKFNNCVTGCGLSSYKSALQDAIDQISDQYEVSQDLLDELNNADDTDLVTKVIKENMPDTKYEITFRGWSGVYWDKKYFDLADVRQAIANYLTKMRKQDAIVSKINKYLYEIETKSNYNGLAVTDNDGLLTMDTIEPKIPEDNELYYYVSIRFNTKE